MENFVSMKVVEKPLRQYIEATLQQIKKRSDTNAKCVLYVDTWIQKNFKSQGAESSEGSWEPLAFDTMERRYKGKKAKYSPKILIDKGDLKNRWKRYADDEKAYLESGVDYGWTHEMGYGHIPQRKILPTKEQIWPKIQIIYKKFLGKVLK
jgi:phage gpG-like protein